MKLLLRFPREADNGIRTDGGIWNVAANVIDNAAIALMGIAPAHGLKDIVIARLERDMKVLTHRGQLRAGLDQPLRKVARMTGGKPNSLNPRNIVHVVEQIGKRMQMATIRLTTR